MRKKPVVFIIIIAVLAAGAITAGVLIQRWYNSPRYALQQMVLALKSRDLETFFNYLDLKEIFNNALESSTKEMDTDDPGGDDWTRFSRQMGRKFAKQIFPKLFDNFEKQIREAIKAYLQDLTNAQILGLAAVVTTAKIETKGNEAQVTVKDPKTGDQLRFRMRRAEEKGPWRIVAVNYDDLKRFLKKEFLGTHPKR